MKKLIGLRKAKNEFNNIVSIGFCHAQNLLKNEGAEPTHYSVRKEGWACDYYNIKFYKLCTGYTPIKSDLKIDTKKLYELNEKALNDKTLTLTSVISDLILN